MNDNLTPEQRARRKIDEQLGAAEWSVQNHKEMDLSEPFVAVREFPTATGPTDYLLYAQGKAIGTVEAKKEGETLSQVETQADRYAKGFAQSARSKGLPHWGEPLSFHYISTGTETLFTNRLDPISRPREVFSFHQGQHLIDLVENGSIRTGVMNLPELNTSNLRVSQIEAIIGLEDSLRRNRSRALVEMATGGGKTIGAIAHAYRLLRYGQAKRILFLVDRRNLGKQARDAFMNWQSPDDGRKFGELYPVQRLTSNRIEPSSSVVITTIQRLYSMLKGEEDFESDREDISAWELSDEFDQQMEISYQPKIPIETFDYIVIDECHRSIYGRWGQVLDYFDAFQVGLTGTASRETYGYFSNNVVGEGRVPNVVSEYSYERSVLDGVNVDYVVYRIKTRISESGGRVKAGEWVELRDKKTRARDPQTLDEDFDYTEADLNAAIVVPDQIRTVIRAFRDGLPELFPGRDTVPKTAVFCRDDSHAEDVVAIIREEFDKGSDFAKKITYKTEGSSDQAIQDFRTDPRFRIAVTVDQISTGTDIKPIECLLFLRKVKSRLLFEQMRGRGVRTIDPNDLRAVTPDAKEKTHFVLVDAVGITDDDTVWAVSPPLDREPSVPLENLLQRLAEGVRSEELLTTLSSRLLRLDRQLESEQREALTQALGGESLADVARSLVNATKPEAWSERAEAEYGDSPSQEQIESAGEAMTSDAITPLLKTDARQAITGINRSHHQVIDRSGQDELLSAEAMGEERARSTIETWREFVEEHHDEFLALSVHYSEPHKRRLSLSDVKELANVIKLPPRNLTTDQIWEAYERLDKSRVHGSGRRQMVDLVSLIRFTTEQDDELTPHAELVRFRYGLWLDEQQVDGRTFTPEQRRWLDMFCEQIASSMTMEKADFDDPPFSNQGGIYHAADLFGESLDPLIEELNRELAVV
jgi:type I restriction enzyme R subunit